MKTIGILGSGDVAKALAIGFQKKGFTVLIGTRDQPKLDPWATENKIPLRSMPEVGKEGELLVLAVNGKNAKEAIALLKPEDIRGKTIMDVTNPISDERPDQGVLKYFTPANYSLMEQLQENYPDLHFVKAFNSAGSAHMVDPKFSQGKPTMFYCGDDANAKKEIAFIINLFGWISKDLGFAPSARPIEALAQLYHIPGILHNQWNHAFHLMEQ